MVVCSIGGGVVGVVVVAVVVVGGGGGGRCGAGVCPCLIRCREAFSWLPKRRDISVKDRASVFLALR